MAPKRGKKARQAAAAAAAEKEREEREREEEERSERAESPASDEDLIEASQVTATQEQSSQQEGASGSQPPVEKRKKKKKPLTLNSEQEEDFINWLKEHPELYDKGKKEYRDVEKKNKLWEDKAAAMEVNVSDLRTWFDSMRTRYGKLTQTKSGQGAKVLTYRDKWVLTNFDFLKGHIHRMVGRSSSKPLQMSVEKPSVSQVSQEMSSPPVDPVTAFEDISDIQDTASEGVAAHEERATPVSVEPTPAKRLRRTASAQSSESEIVQAIKGRIDQSGKIESQLAKLVETSLTITDWVLWDTRR